MFFLSSLIRLLLNVPLMVLIQKELLNALVQMDDLMGSNEINMRIAAMVSMLLGIMNELHST
jgi:hypothetical protein